MFNAIMHGALAAVGLTPQEAHKMVTEAFSKVAEIDARLARIERALGVRNVQPVDTITIEARENDDENRSAAG